MLHFLTTSNIFHLFPLGEEDTLMGTFLDERGKEYSVFSTGQLEKLLLSGKRPVVLSSRCRLGEHDAWWRNLLPPEDVHTIQEEERGHGGGDSFTAFCKRIVEEKYGLSWPVEPVSEWRDEEQPMFWTGALFELNKSALAPVKEVILFTKLLDGGGPLRCCCGNIWRHVPNAGPNQVRQCPSCGRPPENSTSCELDEYKSSRKGE